MPETGRSFRCAEWAPLNKGLKNTRRHRVTVIEDLQNEYRTLSRDVSSLSYFVLIILIFTIGRLIYCLYVEQFESAASSFAVVGILSSVLVVTKSSTRTIAHSEMIRHYEECKDIAQRTHHIMRLLSEIDGRAFYCIDSVESDDPVESFVKNVRKLEDIFEELNYSNYADLYNENSYNFLRSMISAIHWLSVCCDKMSSNEAAKKIGLKSFFQEEFDSLKSKISDLRRYSDKLDDEIRIKRDEASLYS